MADQGADSGLNLKVEIEILGKIYGIQCNEETRESLLASAQLLNERIAHIKTADTALRQDRERIVVTTALNLAYELLNAKHPPQTIASDAASKKVDAVAGLLAAALKQS